MPIPLHHPAITLSLLTTGTLNAPPGQLILGRDPTKASLVIQHPSVSSQHATVTLDRMMVIDHGSTSGTYVGTTKIASGTPTPIDPNGILAFGPVPVQVQLLMRLAQAIAQRGPLASLNTPAPQPVAGKPGTEAMPAAVQGFAPASPGTAMMGAVPSPAAAAPPAAGAPGAKKNKTVLGQLDFSAAGSTKSIGRTPDNDIVISHPQVSSHHAFLHRINGQLFVEDRGAANGTFVRGHRIPAARRSASRAARRSTSARCRCRSSRTPSGAAEIVQEEYSADRWAGKPSTRSRPGVCCSRCLTATTRRR